MHSLERPKENKIIEHLPSINQQSTASPIQKTNTAICSGDFNKVTGSN